MLLIDPRQLEERRRAIAEGRELTRLFESLVSELEPLQRQGVRIPQAKALLSRAGGRCADDGTTLEFDPFAPDAHRCPRCGKSYRGEVHDRAWITSYQLWLAERAVHAAVFAALRADAGHRRLATDILAGYADRYLEYPNVDNVLGPTRLFFSTYLESIWLLQICVAASFLALDGPTGVSAAVRDHIVEPARALIGEFDEGMSNRQVWNNAALIAAAVVCDDRHALERALNGPSGLIAHLSNGLLEDGTWYEGENYHQFALRGLWYGVVLVEAQGLSFPPSLLDRFHRAFAAPFLTALPDFTMPSRKDSQYAVSLRQWRLAELTELGFTRTRDAMLGAALARCYEPLHPRTDTGRARSTADVERNGPSGRLTRADLGWRALLFAVPELPGAERQTMRSAHLHGQGYVVFRRPDDVYVGFDYGQSGGGHGHPDRLNVTLYQGNTRWLDDMGTGSYVDPSLHWYRSTLAHNAPLIGGRSQALRDGTLLAHDEREGLGWASARFDWPELDVTCRRTVVVAPSYLIDEVRVTCGEERLVDLPIHLEGSAPLLTLAPRPLQGGADAEDGFGFVHGAHAAGIPAASPVLLRSTRDGRAIEAHLQTSLDATLFVANAPGQPASTMRDFFLVRSRVNGELTLHTVIAWTPGLEVDVDGARISVTHPEGERHVHERAVDGWHVDLAAGGARSSIDLGGIVREAPAVPLPDKRLEIHALPREGTLRFELGRDHYRRSEQDWDAAGQPAARITVSVAGDRLRIVVEVRAGEPAFPAAGAENPFDNEHPDTMGAGLQLYIRDGAERGGWGIVPEAGSAVRVRRIEPAARLQNPTASWRMLSGGAYEMEIGVPLPAAVAAGAPFDVDLVINETVRTRIRRRGQLVLSGARGEWVYLRGDRHDDSRWIRIVLR